MPETRFYICSYCKVEYIPKRRRVQEYCSNTCRSKAWYARKASNKGLVLSEISDSSKLKKSKEKINLAGIGNAALGSLIANIVANALKSENKNLATKEDLFGLLEELKGRYHPINNLRANNFGNQPYYDIIDQKVVYLGNGDISSMFKMG